LEDFGGFGHAAGADGAAGLPAFCRSDELHAVFEDAFGVALGGGVVPHAFVHGGGEEDFVGVGGEEDGGDEIVGETVGHFGESVGGAGGDDDDVGVLRQTNVLRVFAFEMIPEIGVNRVGGEGAEGSGADEFLSFGGHGDGDGRFGLGELGDEVGDFIGGDAAADADEDGAGGESGSRHE
jgi:hypothetical protein